VADVFVTHGGMNSVSEALVYSTPMVVIPFVSDQPVNARCIEKLGVGKKLEYSAANKNTIKSTVFSVASDSDIKTNLTKVQRLITKAPGNKGGAELVVRYYNEQV
jgi:UDP:flavonoid glycosyltransferase YjiC (YdhE family)